MIKLSVEEKKIINDVGNSSQKKMLESIITYADFFQAKEFVNITGPGHITLGVGTRGYDVVLQIVDELIASGSKTKFPFTVTSWLYSFLQKQEKWLGLFYKKTSVRKRQKLLLKKLLKLGLNPEKNYIDVTNLAKSNTIKYGDVLCWSDAMMVTFANSALGAKVNQAGPILDIFCNIFGKVPNYGLLTKEGRLANVVIKVDVSNLPDASLLGVAVAQKAKNAVPLIYGLEKLLKAKYDEKTLAFLKDFSAGFSSAGTGRIFHINGITPEAKKLKKELLAPQCQTVSINLQEIERVQENFELSWKNLDAKPNLCYIGEADLSVYQLVYWTNEILWELRQNKRKKLKIKTIFLTNNEVLKEFKALPEYSELKKFGGQIKTISPFDKLRPKKVFNKKIITNSTAIRINARIKFCREEELLKTITGEKRR